MRRLVPAVLALVALGAALLPAVAGATPVGRATLYSLREGTEAEALAVGPEGYLWYAGSNRGSRPSNVVGRISPSGAVDEFTVQNTASVPGVGGLTRGPEGDMWFTEPAANRIERVSAAGHPEGFTLPTEGSRPTGIAAAPGGFLWVTLEGTGRIAQVDPAGSAVETTLPAGSHPTAIALGSDSALWMVLSKSAEVVRKSPSGPSISFPLPSSGAFFTGTMNSDIVSGPDGNLWMSQSDGPFLGKIEAREVKPEYVRYRLPMVAEGINLVSNGPDHDVWLAGGSVIGSIGTRGTGPHDIEIGEPACVVEGCEAPIRALAEGPEGELWFALDNRIGRFRPPPLRVQLPRGDPHRRGKDMPLAIRCRGGAAEEICAGKVKVLLRQGTHNVAFPPLGQARFSVPTMKRTGVLLPLSAEARSLLNAKGSLRVRVVAKMAGKAVTKHNYLLRGGR